MKQMVMENVSSVSEFILMGLTDQPELQVPLFLLFFINFIAIVVGNMSLMSLIILNSYLHTPMYFFLFNLSFIDFCYSFFFAPKMLISFISEKNIISFRGCITQLYVLTVMAYDRYVAICKPLIYRTIMVPRTCCLLIFGSYLIGFSSAMVLNCLMLRLNFCDSYTINHYMCDIFPVLRTYVNELMSTTVVGTAIILCSLIILVSYTMILINIIQMSSAKGWSKAMGTCGSHIITVSFFYGSGLLAYVKPSSVETVGQGKFFSVFYTLLVPMLNLLIYSLRNKDVKLAVKKTMRRIINRLHH
uniref:G-protein coupled receptors family 1 profile domain-containing protein n=1 Tax=Nannospalax galili TaxID=1026970 RepID=A0A8C6QQP3_NANGA